MKRNVLLLLGFIGVLLLILFIFLTVNNQEGQPADDVDQNELVEQVEQTEREVDIVFDELDDLVNGTPDFLPPIDSEEYANTFDIRIRQQYDIKELESGHSVVQIERGSLSLDDVYINFEEPLLEEDRNVSFNGNYYLVENDLSLTPISSQVLELDSFVSDGEAYWVFILSSFGEGSQLYVSAPLFQDPQYADLDYEFFTNISPIEGSIVEVEAFRELFTEEPAEVLQLDMADYLVSDPDDPLRY
jgi:hypothetical protein